MKQKERQVMNHTITFSDDELDLIEGLLNEELQTERVEFRRTRNPDFRDDLEHHLDLTGKLIRKLSQAREAA
jgi:hypothetical protein